MDNYYVLQNGNNYLVYNELVAFETEDFEKATKFDIRTAIIVQAFMQKQYGLLFEFKLLTNY